MVIDRFFNKWGMSCSCIEGCMVGGSAGCMRVVIACGNRM